MASHCSIITSTALNTNTQILCLVICEESESSIHGLVVEVDKVLDPEVDSEVDKDVDRALCSLICVESEFAWSG